MHTDCKEAIHVNRYRTPVQSQPYVPYDMSMNAVYEGYISAPCPPVTPRRDTRKVGAPAGMTEGQRPVSGSPTSSMLIMTCPTARQAGCSLPGDSRSSVGGERGP